MLHRLAHLTAATVRVHAVTLVLGTLGCQVAFLRTDVTRSERQLVSILRRRFPALSQRMLGTAAPEANADRVLAQLGRGDIGQRRAPRANILRAILGRVARSTAHKASHVTCALLSTHLPSELGFLIGV